MLVRRVSQGCGKVEGRRPQGNGEKGDRKGRLYYERLASRFAVLVEATLAVAFLCQPNFATALVRQRISV